MKLSKKQVKKLKTGVVGLTLVAALSVAGLSAYFTDQKQATNTFTVGNVSQELIEPSWDPDDPSHTGITPGQEFNKDPQVKNDGTNDQYVFMTVTVPYANVATANDDGTKNAVAETPLFTYTTNAGWTQLTTQTTKDETNKTYTYVYSYGTNEAMTTLVKETTTPALFENIKFANVVEGQNLSGTTQNVVVKSYGIQTNNLNTQVPSAIWDIVSSQAQQ